MQPAFYDDAFRSYFPAARQQSMPTVAAMPMPAKAVVSPLHQQQPIPVPVPMQTVDPMAHVQSALTQFQEKLFADLNAWKQATAASLAETSKTVQTQQPSPMPTAFYPPVMHAPYLYQPMPQQQIAIEKPAAAADNVWKPLSCSSNIPSVVLWFMLIIFFVVAVVLILVYLAKLTLTVNSMSAVFMAKSRGER
jgi:hypothetical protein